MLQLVLLQNLLQSLHKFKVELYLHSLVSLSRRLELQRKQLDYTQLVVQSSLSTESDTLVLKPLYCRRRSGSSWNCRRSTGLYQFQGTGNEAFGRATHIDSFYKRLKRESEKHTEIAFERTRIHFSGEVDVLVEYHFTGQVLSLQVVLVNLSLQIPRRYCTLCNCWYYWRSNNSRLCRIWFYYNSGTVVEKVA